MDLRTIVTRDTTSGGHRTLVAEKRDYGDRRRSVGRPRAEREIVDLVLRLVRGNPFSGCDRIEGTSTNLGHKVPGQSVGNILKEHGVEPAED